MGKERFPLAITTSAKDNAAMSKEKDSKKKPEPDAKRSPGPEPERVKIDGDWEDAAKKLIRKKAPKPGKG